MAMRYREQPVMAVWEGSGNVIALDVLRAMTREPESVAAFDAEVLGAAAPGQKLVLLCRSGVRSVAAARRATELGLLAYNVLEGFEGDADAQGHRGQLGGWRLRGLPWQQG